MWKTRKYNDFSKVFKVNLIDIDLFRLFYFLRHGWKVILLLCFRNLVENAENNNLSHYFALNGGLLKCILTTWIDGIKSFTNFEVFRNDIILENVSFIINSIVKTVNSK